MKHRHTWRLGRVTPARRGDHNFASVRYSCACGKRKYVRSHSRLVVETSRFMGEKK